MRENLICYGIPENTTDAAENCEILETHLELTTTDMTFDRSHRLPTRRIPGKVRPIVVKFHNYNDREKVLVRSFDKNTRDKLRGLNLGVGVQQPLEYRNAHRAFKIMDSAIQQGKYIRIVENKLFVNNVCTCKFIDVQLCDVNVSN